MKKENRNLILGFVIGISVVTILFNVNTIFSSGGIERELESHLKSNSERIVIRGVSNVNKDLDGWYSFTVHVTNIELGYPFREYMRFNSETKELTGYNVLEYKP